MSITILDESTASKIAAGEVIERPASVVKELLENALDAGARRIEVEAREAGRGLIRVTDDGCGMTREDAALALQRFATSKIHSAEDLFAITTFGFRGEALPSIAAVSHLTLVTRRQEADAATRLAAVAGEVVELEEIGAPVGTQISVSRLFYNTPARLKFLKRDAAEWGQIVEVFTRFLFSHPQVAILLTQEGREVMRHTGSGDLAAAALTAWGREAAETMLKVEHSLSGISVHGLISTPTSGRASRSRQFVYVNRRWVRNRTLTHALEEAYRGILPEGRFPAAILLLEVDPGSVDVNVHPTKAEVRLSREQEVHHLVLQAVREALAPISLAPQVALTEPSPPSQSGARPWIVTPSSQGELGAGWAGTLAAPSVFSAAFQTGAREGLELRPLAQLRQTYVLAESGQGLLLVDQHRAQERVFYERFVQARLNQGGEAQTLLTPAAVQLGPQEATAIADQLEELSALGFCLEVFGADAYLVRAVPAALVKQDPAALVRDLAEDLVSEKGEKALERRRERLLISLSCRSAIKGGDPLTYEEMVELLRTLAGTARPYTCPHGWPIVMTISHLEIDRRFNR